MPGQIDWMDVSAPNLPITTWKERLEESLILELDGILLLPDRARPEDTVETLQKAIGEVAAVAKAAQLPFIVCTLPINALSWPPAPRSGEANNSMKETVGAGNWHRTLELAAASPDVDAETEYLRGLALMGLKKDSAREAFLRSVTLDQPQSFRALPAFNDWLRTLASESGVRTIDLESRVNEQVIGPVALPGSDFFYDDRVWRPATTRIAARAVMEAMATWGFIQGQRTAWDAPDRPGEPAIEAGVLRYLLERLAEPAISRRFGMRETRAGLEAHLEALHSRFRMPTDFETQQTLWLSRPESRDRHRALIALSQVYHQEEQGLPSYQALIESGGLYPSEWLAWFRLAVRTKAENEGWACLQTLQSALPESPEALTAEALLRIRFNEDAEFSAWIEAHRLYHPHHAAWQGALGQGLARLGETDEARACFERALQRNPEDDALRLAFGRFWLHVNQPEKTLQLLEPDRLVRCADPRLYFLAGAALQAMNFRYAAVGMFREALGWDPANPVLATRIKATRSALAQEVLPIIHQARETADPQAAATLYARAIALDPESGLACDLLAYLLATTPVDSLRNGALALEIAEYSKYQIRGTSFQTLLALTVAHAELGDFQRAEFWCGQAVALSTEHPEISSVKLKQIQRSLVAREAFRDLFP